VDKIPKMKPNQSCIINLDNSSQPGSHWIALFKTPRRGTIIYDSFGRKAKKILNKKLYSKNPLESIGKYLETENDAEQRIDESNCGQRCLAWLLVCNLYGELDALSI